MTGEILCVGTELLLGDTLNSNAQYLSRQLAELGIDVFFQSVVGDNAVRLQKAVETALSRSDVLLITGGLGPTEDDLTKEAVCAYLGLPLVEDTQSLRAIENYFARSGRKMSENNVKQALRPKGATVLPNKNGTAPGYIVSKNNKHIVLLPGPPAEMKLMFTDHVKPFLTKLSDHVLVSHTLLVTGIGEATLAQRLEDILRSENPTVSPYASPGQVTLRVTASGKTRSACEAACETVISDLTDVLGDNLAGVDKDSLQQVVVEHLHSKGLKLATAESCTAGMLSAKLTDVPGASAVFEIGISAYSNDIKRDALGVNEAILQTHGAISAQTAAAMAMGIRKLSGSDLGLSVTGVAGPDKSEGKPVGLVYIGLADKQNVWVLQLNVSGGENDRTRVREVATKNALDLCRRYLVGLPDLLPGSTLQGKPPHVLKLEHLARLPAVAPKAKPPVTELSDAEMLPLIKQALEESDEDASAEPASILYTPGSTLEFLSERSEGEEEELTPNTLDTQPSVLDDALLLDQEDDFPALEKKEGKTPWYKRLLQNLLPAKGDSVTEIIRKVIFDVALLVFIGCAVYLIVYFSATVSQNVHLNSAREVWNQSLDDGTRHSDGSFARFDVLKNMNSDIKGWITVEGTAIDNPVYQTDNNTYYVNHNMSKERSRYGALFIDSAASVSAEYTSQNLVIYGHHMQDGSMFAALNKYRQLDYYRAHPTIRFDTLYDSATYQIFSVFITNASAAQNNGYVFNYRAADFETQDAFMLWVDSLERRSLINTAVEVQPEDRLITLSTCVYDFTDARLVVVARRVPDGESASVNVHVAEMNEFPLMPQAWYDKYGGMPPGYEEIPVESDPMESEPFEDPFLEDPEYDDTPDTPEDPLHTVTSQPDTSTPSTTPSTPTPSTDTSSEENVDSTPSQPSEPTTSTSSSAPSSAESSSAPASTSTPEPTPAESSSASDNTSGTTQSE